MIYLKMPDGKEYSLINDLVGECWCPFGMEDIPYFWVKKIKGDWQWVF